MGKILFLFLFVNFATVAQSEGIQFETKMADYGNIKFGTSAVFEFKFVNQSTNEISIKNIKSNSRAVSFVINDTIVKPGQKSSIKVIYKTEEVGTIRRTITVFTSGNPSIHTLSIRGNVVKS